MRIITASGSKWLNIRGSINSKANIIRSAARTVAIVGSAALVLACTTADPASAHGGGGHGGGGHGGSMMGGFGKGGSMMRGFGFGSPNASSDAAVSCRNNRTAAHCRR